MLCEGLESFVGKGAKEEGEEESGKSGYLLSLRVRRNTIEVFDLCSKCLVVSENSLDFQINLQKGEFIAIGGLYM